MIEEEDNEYDELEQMQSLLQEGRGLDSDTASQLERGVFENPGDIDSRIKLLGHYFTKWRVSAPTRDARISHIEWLVENHPEHEICGAPQIDLSGDPANYAKIKEKWRAQIDAKPNSAKILSNASRFLDSIDNKLAEFYLVKCTQLEPHNMYWSRQLASLYDRNGLQDARKSFDENARIVELCTGADDLFVALTDLPLRALRACAYKQCLHAAERLLVMAEEFKDDWNYGNAIQSGQTALGLLALKEGDATKAKHHLAQSVIEEPTPQTQIYGPHLELAEKLLEHGETQAVLEYLNQCESNSICGFDNSKFLAFRKRITI